MESMLPQPLGYATPVAHGRRANVWIALTCFALTWTTAVFIIDALSGLVPSSYFVAILISAAKSISANIIGFIIPFLLFRPYARRQRWSPYLLSAVAGALAVLFEWFFFVEVAKFMILNRYSALAASFCGGLIPSIILFPLYRIIVDRSTASRSRIAA